jgi:hypothetical protein
MMPYCFLLAFVSIYSVSWEGSKEGKMSGEQFWRNVDKILAAKGQRRPWLAQQTELPLGRINNWHVRNILPRAGDAELIARSLETTTSALVGTEHAETVPRLDESARDMMDFYQKLSYTDKAAFSVIAKAVWALFKAGLLQLRWKDLDSSLHRLREGE